MKVILIIIAFLIAPWLIAWVVRKIRAILRHIKYSKVLKSMEPSIRAVSFLKTESELSRLNSVSANLSAQLELRYKVQLQPELKSLQEYISHDRAVQRATRKKPVRSARSRYYRRRWY